MRLILLLTIAFTFITGCATTDNTMSEREQIADELDPNQHLQEPTNDELNSKLGYVRYTKDSLDNTENGDNPIISMDRNEMADSITRIILRNHGFEEVATLVTDKEVLIAYDRNEDISAEAAADVARRTALSIMPSFFSIHVSDDDVLMNDIQSLHNSTSDNRDYDNTINRIIEEMKKSPQGQDNH